MTLIVPTAGTSPGRAARAQERPAGQTGTGIEAIGQTIMQIGALVEQDRNANQIESARLEAVRGLNRVRADIGDIADPYEAEAAWTDRSQAVAAEAQKRIASLGISPAEKEQFDLSIEQIRDQHALTLGRRFIAEKSEYRRNMTAELGGELALTWLEADGSARDAVAQQFFDHIDMQAAAGFMTPDAAEKAKSEWENRALDLARARNAELEADEIDRFFPEVEVPLADLVDDKLEADPDLARLARSRQYLPLNQSAVQDMAALIERAEAMEPDQRQTFIDRQVEAAMKTRRAALPRPAYQRQPVLDAPELEQTARRLGAAWRAGQITDAEFQRQAELLRQHRDLMNG